MPTLQRQWKPGGNVRFTCGCYATRVHTRYGWRVRWGHCVECGITIGVIRAREEYLSQYPEHRSFMP